jgi:hypothetical protein
VPPLYAQILFLKKTKISIFGSISEFCLWAEFGKFWQFWAILGIFEQNLLHWQWLTACPNFD